MVDITHIASAVSGLKAAAEIASSMKGIHDAALVQSKVIELQAVILKAQSDMFVANDERSRLLEEAKKLERQLEEAKKWEKTAGRYELMQIGHEVYAYSLRREEIGPHHWACPNCFQKARLSILQRVVGTTRYKEYACLECKSQLVALPETTEESRWTTAEADYDPLAGT